MTTTNNNIFDFLRSGWFLIIFIGGIVWWAAQQASAISEIQKSDARITMLENRAAIMESGIGQLQIKIDGIKEDVALIKTAVIPHAR